LEYITEKDDAYEPNEGPLTSTPLSPDKVYNGLIDKKVDQDWYRITLTKKQNMKLTVGYIPDSMTVSVVLRNKKLQTLQKWSNTNGQRTLIGERSLLPGTYYVSVSADTFSRSQYYGLRVQLSQR
jgi:hypothetical protein